MIVKIQRGKEIYFFESSKIESIRLYLDTYNTNIVNVIEVTTTGRIHFISYDENEKKQYKKDWKRLLKKL